MSVSHDDVTVPRDEDVLHQEGDPMKSGFSMHFQNYRDWDRYEAQERGEDVPGAPLEYPDTQIWDEELDLALRAEDWGFDSVWTVEHHFTPYTMTPNPLMFCAYIAAKTKRVDVGTMVVVLPWHNPLLIAEDMTLVQHFLGADRDLRVGVGRGIARREYDGLSIPQGESRQRFQEGLDIIRLALSEDRFSYDGEIWKLGETSLRPRTQHGQRLLDNMLGAWGSPRSVEVMGRNGLRPLVIPQRDLALYDGEIREWDRIAGENGHELKRPAITLWAYCDENSEYAWDQVKRYNTQFADSSLRHYEMAGDHFKDIPGYEDYAARAAMIKSGEVNIEQVTSGVAHANIAGTPEECIAGLEKVRQTVPTGEFIFHMKFGSMTHAEAEKSVDLFAKEVLPAVKEMQPTEYATA